MFHVTILFVLMFHNRMNAMTGDFHLRIDSIFNLFLSKPFHMPSKHSEYETSCKRYILIIFTKRLKNYFSINIEYCSLVLLIAKPFVLTLQCLQNIYRYKII